MISVIIPTHYRADRLKRAIESVRKQSYKDIEIIVISDGYDEETDILVKEILKSDKRVIYYVNSEPLGANVARNKGISISKGDYIAFLDDDDIWYSSKLEKQLCLFKQNSNLGLVGCGIRVVNTGNNINYNTIFNDSGNLSLKILYGNCIGSTSCVMIKREVIEKCGLFDESLPARQDYDYWIRICQEFEVDFVKEVQLDYYVYASQGKSSQISSSFDKYFKSFELINKKYEYLISSYDNKTQKYIMAQGYRNISVRASDNGKKAIAIKYLLLSLKLNLCKETFKCVVRIVFPKNVLIWIRSKV